MKDPLYALLVAPDLKIRKEIIEGTKTATVREGHRDYKAGNPVMLCCHLQLWAVMADITNAHCTTIPKVTQKECEAAGFQTREELLSDLQRFYPGLNENSEVTVICWKNVRGLLAGSPAQAHY